MDRSAALKISERFISLPLEKRKRYFEKMIAEGVSAGNLPIPAIALNADSIPLSYAQQRQWFLWQLDPDSAAYHIPSALRLRGELDVAALTRSFNALIARHQTLRTTVTSVGEQPVQTIHAEQSLVIETVPLSTGGDGDESMNDEEIHRWIKTEVQRSFDLHRGPLLRVTLLQLAADDHVLVLVQHHIVSDGWSMQVMVEELVQLYTHYSQQREFELPALPIQYTDYAIWQRSWMEAGEQERQLAYWTAQLGGEQSVLQLPMDRSRPSVPSHRGAHFEIPLPLTLSAALKTLSQREQVTLFMLLLASFQVFLYRYSGQRDIRVGTPIANRNRVETERLLGFFVNTLVLKAELEGQLSFRTALQQIKQMALDAQSHQDLPFEKLVEALQPERTLSHTPLFQVMYNHQSGSASESQIAELPGLRIDAVEWESQSAQFDLTLDTFETGERLSACFTYATDLFDATTIERLAQHWINLLEGIAADPTQRINTLPLLDVREKQILLRDWNATWVDYSQHSEVQHPSVHQLFEEQVTRSPDAIALIFGNEQLSYSQLNSRANQLAHRLIKLGVGPDVLVGIAIERSLDMVIGLLAILKAGGAYVPLDPSYPEQRLTYMLQDSGVCLLLTHTALLTALPAHSDVTAVCLDHADSYSGDDGNPLVAVHPENLAYVIYTSGSTGQPKGAGNRHSALTNRLQWMQQQYALSVLDTVLQKTPFSFDVSVWEFFWPLLAGARLAIAAPDEHRDPARLIATIQRHGVTTLHFVPSMLQAFLHNPNVTTCTRLTRIICSGEALPIDAQQQVFAKLPQANLYNLYGPTEAAIDVTHWTCCDEGRSSVPIGRPIANVCCLILSDDVDVVPVGTSGELYLGGVGLARGYHQRAALTAERFLPNPFDAEGGRIYRSGDLARYRADAAIDYIGRIDHQVKIRGLRIELGEIEAQLTQQTSVRDAVVIAQQRTSGQQLIAYVVPNASHSVDITCSDQCRIYVDRLKAVLGSRLPDYMVPPQWVLLEKLPLSPNGKLDRKALPEPDASTTQQTYIAPQHQIEKQIAAIWQEVLGIERVGLSDNFFELGGDSIVSLQVVSRARQAGIQLKPRDLFQHQTVQGLASIAQVLDVIVAIDQEPVQGEVPLTPIQHWFFETDIADRQHWNQSLLLTPKTTIDADALEQTLQLILSHHDALRLIFKKQVDGCKQVNAAPDHRSVLWRCVADSNTALSEVCEEAQRSLDLQDGPLLRAALIAMADGSQRLLLVIHHLAIDGVSWRILLEDLQTAYRQICSTQSVQLPAKTSSFKAWGEQLQGLAKSESLTMELAQCEAQLLTAPIDLPCDNRNGSLQSRHAGTVYTRLDKNVTRQLLQQAAVAYRTQINDLLLTALARVITQWSGKTSALIQLEGHGREELFDEIDLTRTVGWFTSMFPVQLSPADDIGTSIKRIKEQLRVIPKNGISYGVLRYLAGESIAQRLKVLPEPRITFNYLGQFDSSFDTGTALFDPASESAGATQSMDAPLGNWLSVDGQIYDGELSLGWTFSCDMFDTATVQNLADMYANELHALIEHCCAPNNTGVTPSDFPLARLTQAQLDALILPASEIDDIYPLSPMQQGMLFHTLYDRDSGDYINQLRIDIEGLDIERFESAWQAAVAAHGILRTSFVTQFETALQIVHKQVTLPFTVHDSHAPFESTIKQNAFIDALADRERQQGFVLAQAPLLRLALVRTSANSYHLIYTHHHILLDGWSTSQLLGEVLRRYQSSGAPIQQTGSYRDYIAWLQRQDAQAGETFWKIQLRELEEPTRLAQAIRTEVTDTYGYDDFYQALDSEQTTQLKTCALHHKVTVNTFVQSAWLLLLQRYTGQDCVALGATVAGRPAELHGVEQRIGLFINTLPVIAAPDSTRSVAEWLQQLQALNLSLRDYEHTPLYDIQRWAERGGDALFDTLLVFENYPVADALRNGAPQGLHFGEVTSREQTNYALTVAIGLGEMLTLHYSYDKRLFAAPIIAQIHNGLMHLLTAMVANTAQSLGELTLFAATQSHARIQSWNSHAVAYGPDRCVHELIADQAAVAPDNIALQLNDEQLTYQQLNTRANRLAHRLIALGVGPEVRVGIAVERSLDMVVGLLAILKAGGAYVPLDPDYPDARLSYMIADSGIELLLLQSHLRAALPIPSQLHTLAIDLPDSFSGDDSNPSIYVHPDNLAYVIYTSGSTGKPKGALLPHHNIVRLFRATQQWFNFDQRDTWTLFHSYAFDFSVWEIFGALVYGGRLIIVPQDVARSPQDFYALLCRERVTVLNQTPSAFKQLMQIACGHISSDLDVQHSTASLRYVVFGGEALDVNSLRPWFERFGAHTPQLINMYGITETTVHVTYRPLSLADLDGAVVSPLGERISDLSWYLLDRDIDLTPNAAIGELFIGGAGLARGYHGRAGLTAERFLPNPFADDGSRLYRSGDLARSCSDDVIDYVGRIDHQVKIRGFRIELGEIEARLREQAAIREAVVLSQANTTGQQLIAYIVVTANHVGGDDAQRAVIDTLRRALKSQMPDYMVPAHFVVLEQLPLTANGKLDRKALPQPASGIAQQIYIAPATPLEKQIAAIWQTVLGIGRVGLHDNFFELGGHSLLVTQVVVRLREQLDVELPIKALFVAKNLSEFVEDVKSNGVDLSTNRDALTKSLEALKRLSADDLEKLIS